MATKDAAIRKRTQIAKANRTMFVWVAAVSVVFGFALVGSIFLAQKIFFNEKVLAEKDKTISILNKDNSSVSELESQVRVLDTNQALATAKAKPTDQTIQVILDALPSEANSLALGASLQNVLLNGVSGLSLQSLQVDPVVGVESLSTQSSVQSAAAATGTAQPEITFRFSVKGNEAALREGLSRLERSIRAIDIISLTIENQGSNQLMTVEARAFYEPARTVELKNKVIKS